MKRFLFLLLPLFIVSCDKKYVSSIPDFPVSLELDLNFEDKDLITQQSYKTFTTSNINPLKDRVGFGGVLVYHGLNSIATTDAYYAFDLACPYEATRSTIIEVDNDGIFARCPKCKTKYELLNGIGNPVEGPNDKEQLKKYTVNYIESTKKIYVSN